MEFSYPFSLLFSLYRGFCMISISITAFIFLSVFFFQLRNIYFSYFYIYVFTQDLGFKLCMSCT